MCKALANSTKMCYTNRRLRRSGTVKGCSFAVREANVLSKRITVYKEYHHVRIFGIHSSDRCLSDRMLCKNCRNYHPVAQNLHDGQGAASQGGGAWFH